MFFFSTAMLKKKLSQNTSSFLFFGGRLERSTDGREVDSGVTSDFWVYLRTNGYYTHTQTVLV